MDDAWLTTKKAELVAIQAMALGYQAENQSCILLGEQPKYGLKDFEELARQADRLANYIRQYR